MYNNQKYILIVFLIIIFAKTGFSQYWMNGFGSVVEDEAMSVSKDVAGNLYTTGYFGGSAQFSGITLSSSGASDVFLMKNNSSGQVIWAIKAGGFGEDRGLSIKTDAVGNSYITGFFYGTATFDTQTLVSAGAHDIFIAKYNSSGNLVWVIQAGGSGADISNAVSIDIDGNIIITGQFIGTSTFGSTTITSLINPQTGLNCTNTFIAKYDSDGNFLWVKHGESDNNCRGISITSDLSGNIFATGEFSDTLSFDILHNNNINNAIYVVKLDSLGNEQWFKRIGASLHNVAYCITTDMNQDVLLTGEANGTLCFFDNPNYMLSNSYNYQAFLAKFSNSGDLLWAVSDGSESEVSPQVVCADDNNNIYITGDFYCKFSEYADFFGQGTFNSIGYRDIFVTKYDVNGQRLWMRNFGGKKEDHAHGMVILNDKPIIAGGFIYKLIVPTTSTINSNHLTSTFYSPNINFNFCNDSKYGKFTGLRAYGTGSDIFLINAININRQPYDYYNREGSVCDRPYVGCCIIHSDSVVYKPDIGCEDSLEVCDSTYLHAISNTASILSNYYSTGPNFTYLWSTGEQTRSIKAKITDDYIIEMTSEDGCFQSTDTFNLEVHISPEIPWISDDHGIGNNSCTPYHI